MKTVRRLNALLRWAFACGLAWALCSDPIISRLTTSLQPMQREAVRVGSNILWFGVTILVLNRQLHRQQKALFRSEREYRHLFASNPNPMWVYDRDTLQFLMINQAAIEHYGYTREQFLRMNIFDLRPPEEHQRLRKMVQSTQKGLHYAGTWTHMKADGQRITVAVRSHDVKFNDRDGRLVLVTDVTELISNREQLSKANQTSLDLAWSFSHELRGPLASMLGLLPLLREAEAGERQHMLAMLEESALALDLALQASILKVCDLGDIPNEPPAADQQAARNA